MFKIIVIVIEGGMEFFLMKYFEEDVFFVQSFQFYKQIMMVSGFDRVYEIVLIFRVEEYNIMCYLNEVWSIDSEMVFIEDEEEVMSFFERFVVYVINYVCEYNVKEFDIFNFEFEEFKFFFLCVSYDKVFEIFGDFGKEIFWGEDIDIEGERFFGKYMMENENVLFYFFYQYLSEVKLFYIMKYDNKFEICRVFDFEYRGVEISFGGQREYRYDIFVEQIKEKGFNLESFEFYFKVFCYGMLFYGGFGFGVERLIKQMFDFLNIREVILFLRDRRRLIL